MLNNIVHIHNLKERLPRYSRMSDSTPPPSFRHTDRYPDLKLLHPRRVLSFQDHGLLSLQRRIAVHIATQLNATVAAVKALLPPTVVSWSRVRISESDTVYAHESYKDSEAERRDSTFMEYEQLVDRHRNRRRAAPHFESRTFFGQLQRILVVDLPASDTIHLRNPRTYILLDVHMCNTNVDRYGYSEYRPGQMGVQEVVDGTSLRALVGRMKDRGKYAIVQRKGDHQHAEYVEEEDEL